MGHTEKMEKCRAAWYYRGCTECSLQYQVDVNALRLECVFKCQCCSLRGFKALMARFCERGKGLLEEKRVAKLSIASQCLLPFRPAVSSPIPRGVRPAAAASYTCSGASPQLQQPKSILTHCGQSQHPHWCRLVSKCITSATYTSVIQATPEFVIP